jgi:hypothetical protein
MLIILTHQCLSLRKFTKARSLSSEDTSLCFHWAQFHHHCQSLKSCSDNWVHLLSHLIIVTCCSLSVFFPVPWWKILNSWLCVMKVKLVIISQLKSCDFNSI